MRARHRHLQWTTKDACNLWLDSRFVNQANNSQVSQWDDRSGLSRNVTQATPGSRPLFKTNQQGGSGAIYFDGSDDRFIGTSVNWNGLDVTCFYLARLETNIGYVFYDGTATTGTNAFHFGTSSGPAFFGNGWNNQTPRAWATPGFNQINNWALCSATLSGSSQVYSNGAVPAATDNANGSLSQGSGATFQIGHETFWWLKGHVSFVAIFASALSGPLRRKFEHAAAYSFKISCN